MKATRDWLLSGLLLLVVSAVMGQGKITGTIIDETLNSGVPGVNVTIKGTSVGTVTDMDGKFSIETTAEKGQLVVSFVGFETTSISFTVQNGQAVDLGSIRLKEDAGQLDEVVVVGRGIIDLAKDRKTPIAVSTIKSAEIVEKIGAMDITQTMVNTPSVYVAGQAGGFGDSRISVRGFQQDNTAFLLNGQPINGMEDGKMYWSNWSGMSDIANFIQIQRGLGSSKLAISSVGGTVNFVTKATDKREGGFVSSGVGNDSFLKTTAAYNTGIMKNGFGVSVLLTHWQGDGYNEGTQGRGQNYFISFGYKPNDKHTFNFLITGAPQEHDQNFTKRISDYLTFGRKYNSNWGTLDGEYVSERTNFYHKPVANLNWDYNINSTTSLSTVVYASWGRGGGTGNYGRGKGQLTSDGQINFDEIYSKNVQATNGIGSAANYAIRASMNNHAWYGIVSNFKKELDKNLNLNFGLDLRTYNGDHYRQISNFVGLKGWTESRFLRDNNHVIPNPNTLPSLSNTVTASYNIDPWHSFFNNAPGNQKIDYDYSETISYGGVFGQLEYANDNFSTFVQGAVSNQTHQRFDYYDYQKEFQDSEKVANIGYNVKGGIAYVVANKHSVYANAGYYSRQPYHDNIYLNFTNQVNPLTENEKVLGLEAGYSFKSKLFNASINAYRTTWEDRVITTSGVVAKTDTIGTTIVNAGDLIFTENQGVKQVHSGIELDFILKPTNNIDLKGFASVGNWIYEGDAISTLRDENLNPLDVTKTDIDGGKVGDAAQTSWGLGIRYELLPRFSIDADWRNYDKLYANTVTNNNLELPNYDLMDAGVSYKMLVGKNKQNAVNIRINVNNVFNEIYLSEISSSNASGNVNGVFPTTSESETYKGIDVRNNAFFGLGRTWNASIRYTF